jgi:hypothetical protein
VADLSCQVPAKRRVTAAKRGGDHTQTLGSMGNSSDMGAEIMHSPVSDHYEAGYLRESLEFFRNFLSFREFGKVHFSVHKRPSLIAYYVPDETSTHP